MTIISCSYKSDVPAYYGQWFLNRLEAGYAKYVNPYNGGVYEVSLRPGDATGVVFWTRDPRPLLNLRGFDKLQEMGIPFYIQLTHTNYPRSLERGKISTEKTIKTIRELNRRFGRRVVVWRYDPIIFTEETDENWHFDNFAELTERFSGLVDEVTISFVNLYAKSTRNLAEGGIHCEEMQPDVQGQRNMTTLLADIAGRSGMALSVCSQSQAVAGLAQPASCVDIERLSDIAGRDVYAPLKGNRPDCLCAASKDIGAYDTCLRGCRYCYAVNSPTYARAKFRRHDPEAEFLVVPDGYEPEEKSEDDLLQLALNIVS
jgi:hypothetical protein